MWRTSGRAFHHLQTGWKPFSNSICNIVLKAAKDTLFKACGLVKEANKHTVSPAAGPTKPPTCWVSSWLQQREGSSILHRNHFWRGRDFRAERKIAYNLTTKKRQTSRTPLGCLTPSLPVQRAPTWHRQPPTAPTVTRPAAAPSSATASTRPRFGPICNQTSLSLRPIAYTIK